MSKEIKTDIENMLNESQPVLSSAEKALLWLEVEQKISSPQPVVSPFLFSLIKTRHMTPIALILMVLLGAGGTVAASESSRPGDLLFPIDRAIEDVRLALASDDTASRLRSQFAEERLMELRSILDEEVHPEVADSDTTGSDTATPIATTTASLSFEAHVYSDITTIRAEIDNRLVKFTSTSTERNTLVTEIAARFDLDETIVDSALRLDVEDRISRPRERGEVAISENGEQRVKTAVDALLKNLEKLSDSDLRAYFLRDLLAEIDDIRVDGRDLNSRLSIDDSRIRVEEDKIRAEVRDKDRTLTRNSDDDDMDEKDDEHERVRVKLEDSRVDFKTEVSSWFGLDKSVEKEDDSDRESEVTDPVDQNAITSFGAVADVYSDTTVITVEINGRRKSFENSLTRRSDIADSIADRYDVDPTLVEEGLEVNDLTDQVYNVTVQKREDDDEDDHNDDEHENDRERDERDHEDEDDHDD